MSARGRWWLVFVAGCAAVWVLVGWSACEAQGQSGVQPLADETAAWISDVMRVPFPAVPVVVGDDFDIAYAHGEHDHGDGVIRLRPWVADSATRGYPDHLHRGRFHSPGTRLLVHELLHRRDQAVCDRTVEEGVVDAVTWDLMPAWWWRFRRQRIEYVDVGYPREVAAIRAASRYATGARTWRERAPRLWRRALLVAGCAERDRMMAAAVAARDEGE